MSKKEQLEEALSKLKRKGAKGLNIWIDPESVETSEEVLAGEFLQYIDYVEKRLADKLEKSSLRIDKSPRLFDAGLRENSFF